MMWKLHYLAWFKSYLSDRYQFVTVNEETYRSTNSVWGTTLLVLGPLLLFLGDFIRKH